MSRGQQAGGADITTLTLEHSAQQDALQSGFGASLAPHLLDASQAAVVQRLRAYATSYFRFRPEPPLRPGLSAEGWPNRFLPPFVIQWLGSQDALLGRRQRIFPLEDYPAAVQRVYDAGYASGQGIRR